MYVELYHGDCMEIMPGMDVMFNVCLTDPPYGLKKDSKNGRGKLKNRVFNAGKIETWDFAPSSDCFDLIFKKSSKQIIWGGNYFNLPPCRCFVVWDKCQPWDNFSKCEYAWTSYDAPAKLFKFDTRSFKKAHPTQKPLPLIQYCLDTLCEREDTIVDPFAGSGTTGIACMKRGKKCVLIEKDEAYCELAATLLSQEILPLFETGDDK